MMVIDEDMLDAHNWDVPDLIDTIRDAWVKRDAALYERAALEWERDQARRVAREMADPRTVNDWAVDYPWLKD